MIVKYQGQGQLLLITNELLISLHCNVCLVFPFKSECLTISLLRDCGWRNHLLCIFQFNLASVCYYLVMYGSLHLDEVLRRESMQTELIELHVF